MKSSSLSVEASARRRLPTRLLALTLLVGSVTSCNPGSEPDATLPRSPPVVVVTMREYRFDYERPIPAGRVVFRVPNRGRLLHRLTLLPIAEGLPPIDEQLRDNKASVASPFAGTRPQPSGSSGAFAVDLVANTRYAMLCFVVDRAGEPHALKGMNSEFRAGAVPGTSEDPPVATGV